MDQKKRIRQKSRDFTSEKIRLAMKWMTEGEMNCAQHRPKPDREPASMTAVERSRSRKELTLQGRAWMQNDDDELGRTKAGRPDRDGDAWVQLGIEIPLDVKNFLEEEAYEGKMSVAAVIAEGVKLRGKMKGKPAPASIEEAGRRARGRPRAVN
jgi:hypothetical protein